MVTDSPAAASPRRRRGGGNQRLRAARLLAVQTLYGMSLSGRGVAPALAALPRETAADLDGATVAADPTLARLLIQEATARRGALVALIDGALTDGRRFARLDPVLQCVFLAGACEIVLREDTDAAVLISEYVIVAAAFFNAAETALVNGALDRLLRTVRGASPLLSVGEDDGDDDDDADAVAIPG